MTQQRILLQEISPWIAPTIRAPHVYDTERDKGTDRSLCPLASVTPEIKEAVTEFIHNGGVDRIPTMSNKELIDHLKKFGLERGISGLRKEKLQEALYTLIESDLGVLQDVRQAGRDIGRRDVYVVPTWFHLRVQGPPPF